MKVYLNCILMFFSFFSYSQEREIRLMHLTNYYQTIGNYSIADSLINNVDTTKLHGYEYELFRKLRYKDLDNQSYMDEEEKENNEFESEIMSLYILDQKRTLDLMIRPNVFDFITKGFYNNLTKSSVKNCFNTILIHQSRIPMDKYTSKLEKLINQNENNRWSKEYLSTLIDNIAKSKGMKPLFGSNIDNFNQFGYSLEETIDDSKLNDRRISFGLPPINLTSGFYKNRIFLMNNLYMDKIGYISPLEYLNYEDFNNK